MLVEVVWQLVLVQAKKSHCFSLRFLREAPTKKKSHCYSLRFLRKAPTKKPVL